jgi:hypothetical protein
MQMQKIMLAAVLALAGTLSFTGVASADNYHHHHGHHHVGYGGYGPSHHNYHHHSYHQGGYGGCASPIYQSYRPVYAPPTQFYYQRQSGGYPYYAPRSSFGIYFGY